MDKTFLLGIVIALLIALLSFSLAYLGELAGQGTYLYHFYPFVTISVSFLLAIHPAYHFTAFSKFGAVTPLVFPANMLLPLIAGGLLGSRSLKKKSANPL